MPDKIQVDFIVLESFEKEFRDLVQQNDRSIEVLSQKLEAYREATASKDISSNEAFIVQTQKFIADLHQLRDIYVAFADTIRETTRLFSYTESRLADFQE